MKTNRYSFQLVIFVVLSMLAASASWALDPPIAHWRLDETEGETAQDAIAHRHGTLVNNATWAPEAGKYGGALQTEDDSSYVMVDDSDMSLFDELGIEFTVSVWVSVFEFTSDWQGIVFKNDKFFLERNNSGGNGTVNGIHFKAKDETGSQPFNLYGNILIDDGYWHHVVGVYDVDKAYLYVDGELDVEGDADGNFIGLIEEPLLIGAKWENTYRNSWNGLIDDVKFFDYPMTWEQVDSLFSMEYTGIEEKYGPGPQFFALKDNYPNPFNPTTNITFNVPKNAFVTLDVVNVNGQKIRTLVNEQRATGTHTVTWDGYDDQGRQMPSGVYFYQMAAEDFSKTRKMLLAR